jgi:iron complex outermembrane receptor protein
LSGRNAIGGAIAILTNLPDPDTAGGEAEILLGADDRFELRGVANLPLGRGTALRLAGARRREDGYGRRLLTGQSLGGQDAIQLRGTLLLSPAERLTVRLAADYSERHDDSPVTALGEAAPNSLGAPATLFAGLLYNNLIREADGIAPCQRPGFPIPFCGIPGLIQMPTLPAGTPRYDTRWLTGNPFTSLANGPTGSDFEGYGLAATIQWDAAIRFRSITAYRRFDAAFGRDPDGAPLVLIDTANLLEHEQFSQELQLSDSRPGLSWVAGLYYFEEEGSDRGTAPFAEETFRTVNALGLGCTLLPGATGLPAPVFVSPCPNIFRIDYSADGAVAHSRSIAAFGEASIDLNDWLSVTGGLRWTRDRKTVDISGFLVGRLPVSPNPVARRSFSRLTPRVIVRAQIAPDAMAYASWSTGFKSGGFNQRYGAPIAAPTSFEPESVRSFELGLRAPLGRQARVRLTGFWSAYEDIQAVVFDAGIPRTINAARGRSRGIEVEADWRPTPRLTIAASYGWLDARFTRLDPAIIGSFGTPIVNPLRLDNRFVNAPRHSLALSAEWEHDLGRLGRLRLRGDVSHRSSVANDAVNTVPLVAGPVTLVNGRITYLPSERWSAALFVTNLLDERYIVSGAADLTGFGAAELNFAPPRRWGVSLGFSW